jgi:hypothetical protein
MEMIPKLMGRLVLLVEIKQANIEVISGAPCSKPIPNVLIELAAFGYLFTFDLEPLLILTLWLIS